MRARLPASLVVVTALTLLGSPMLLPAPHAQEATIMAAMQDELKRSMSELRLKGEPAPYFIEYEIDDSTSFRTSARLSGLSSM